MSNLAPERTEVSADTAPIIEHLIELRKRLMFTVFAVLAAFIFCYMFSDDVFNFLVEPLAETLANKGTHRLIFTSLPEVFFTKIKLSLFAAVFLAFPVIAFQMYHFLAPGLYKAEKRLLLPYLVAAPTLFLLGGALAYFYIFPFAWNFFVSFEHHPVGNIGLPIELEARVGEYLKLSMQIILAFGFAFQLPVILTILAQARIISAAWLKARRKYAVVILITIAAIITPPDVISQIGLFIALYLLYELSIISCSIIEKKRQKE